MHGVPKCENFYQFVEYIIAAKKDKKVVLLLDRVDEINFTMLGDDILRQLIKLNEITESNISIIMSSYIPYSRSIFGLAEPIVLYLEPPARIHMKRKILEEMPKLLQESGHILVPSHVFSRLTDIIVQELHPVFPNLSDLKALMLKLYPKFLEPCINSMKENGIDISTISEHIPKYMGIMISGVQRDIKSLLTSSTTQNALADISCTDLPIISRYVLLASYIASYLPDFDFSLLSKRKRIIKNKPIKQYIGYPKQFNISKILHNFDNIIAGHDMKHEKDILVLDYIPRQGQSAQALILQQLTSLSELGLIVQPKNTFNVQKAKYQAKINYNTAQLIAESINFPLAMYH